MILLDGKQVAKSIRDELKKQVDQIVSEGKRAPQLGIIIVGHNPASETYVANKMNACSEVGIIPNCYAFEDNISESELLACVNELNNNADIDGFIVQLPLPAHINEQQVVAAIDYRKDVDGLTPENFGRMMQGMKGIMSSTPRGIRELLNNYNITTQGKHVVVIGRSNIVGKPMAALLLQKEECGNATVTICHSHTKNLKQICQSADIIVSASGQPNMITADMISEGAVIIDVGITRVPDTTRVKGYRLTGDVDFDNVAPKCSYITPVPGGVGPMTVASLLQNTMEAYRLNEQKGK